MSDQRPLFDVERTKRKSAGIPSSATGRRVLCPTVGLHDGLRWSQRGSRAGAASPKSLIRHLPRASQVVTPYPPAYAAHRSAPAGGPR